MALYVGLFWFPISYFSCLDNKKRVWDSLSFLPSFIPPSLPYSQFPHPPSFSPSFLLPFPIFLSLSKLIFKCFVFYKVQCLSLPWWFYYPYEYCNVLRHPSPLSCTGTRFISSLSPAALLSKIFSLFLISWKYSGLYWERWDGIAIYVVAGVQWGSQVYSFPIWEFLWAWGRGWGLGATSEITLKMLTTEEITNT